MNEPLDALLRRALALLDAGRPAMACLLVRARGSTPQSAGALMLVDDAARTAGTIGGGCVEAEVRRRAHEMRAAGATGVLAFKLDHDYGWDDGLICGGTIELAVAPLRDRAALARAVEDVAAGRPATVELVVDGDDGPARYALHVPARERLHVAGAGHVGQALARLALALEYEVTLFDDRADLLAAAVPEGARGVGGPIAEALRAAPVDERTSCVVVTRGHRHDGEALGAVVGRGAAYVGMIGSRRKVKLILDELRERGAADADLAAVHAPIGLDIGAVTVEEIAVSIAAQLVKVRRAAAPALVTGPHAGEAGSAA